MPSEPRPLNGTSQATATDPGLVTSTIAKLRAEHDAAKSSASRAILLYEIGVLEELLGDEAASARDLLGAVNAEPEFREPLERLIAIIERRQSFKNLGKLLERLVRVADGPEERARALIERATYLADHENEPVQAREALELALEEKNDDAGAWLMLEIMAGKLGDDELRAHSLAARCELTEHATWRCLLLIDRAECQLAAEDTEGALGSLEQALAATSTASFLALLALEEVGRRADRADVTARALDAQAGLIMRSTEDPAAGDALGVPRHRRQAHAADAWLRAADAQRRKGDLSAATALLDRALERLADEPAVSHARRGVAELAGDTATAARLARAELERGTRGPIAAALWLRVAEAAASEGDASAALAAVSRALEEDAGSIPARALNLDLLGAGDDAPALAAALEATADQLPTNEGKARYYLSSADTWARVARDLAGAKAALSQAGVLGVPPGLIARIARMLAALLGEQPWYEEATRRLLAAGAGEAEQTGLWFELARTRLKRGDIAGAMQALDALAQTPSGGWLGHALRAYALGLVPPLAQGADAAKTAAASAVRELSRADTDPASSRALRVVVALRDLIDGRRDEAAQELEELYAADPADPVVAAALSGISRARGERKRAAEVLSGFASAAGDTELNAACQLEAGITFWQNGERRQAVDCFTAAAALAPEAAGAMLAWALRAAEPNSIDARRRALEAHSDGPEHGVLELERFALELGRGGDVRAAARALDAIGDDAAADVRGAATLARALWSPPDAANGSGRARGLSQLEERYPAAAAVARASLHELLLETGASEPAELERSAANWADADPAPAAALEWLSHAVAAGARQAEVQAREALADRLSGPASTALRSSARIVAMLGGSELEPLVRAEEPAARLTNLELAPPGCDPRRRAAALLGLGNMFGEESTALAAALAGYNQLAELDIDAALGTFRGVVEAHPEEIIGWEGLRATAEVAEDRAIVAEACAALGDAVSDAARGAELWEEAALILLDELGDEERGEFALSRAIERDIGRAVAFDRLFRIVRSRKDGRRLLELITRRLVVAEDAVEIAKLWWERARVLRESGDREGALAALENVTLLEPDHVGALALTGEIYITSRNFAQAAENLARLSTLDEAPVKQRLMSGVAAVDLYENKLDDVHKALEVLTGLYRAELSTLPVRERLARAAAKAGAWQQAAEVLEQLMHERETRDGRIDAARLALVIHRDRIGEPAGAERAADTLLAEAPGDGEALDLMLSNAMPERATQRLLLRGLEALVEQSMRDPLDPERVDRLARIAARLGRAPLRQAALGALVALGEGSHEIDRELAHLDERVAHVPAIAIDEAALPELCDADDTGPLPALMRELASTFAEALGPGLAALGVGKKERVDPRAGLPVRNEIAAWAGALGVGDFDLYVGGRDPHGVFAVPTERPALVVGGAVQAPLSPMHRQLVARELFALRRGTTILRHRDAGDVAALVVAACKLAGHALPAPPYAMLGEFTRLLGKEMPRKVKKALFELTGPVVQVRQDPVGWVRAAIASLDRMAVVAAGDVSWVLGGSVEGRGHVGSSMEAQERARRLLGFVLSPAYLTLRERLGMGVR